jgi:hypothetical protein
MLSRTLSGRRSTKEIDIATFLAICQIIGPERDRTLQLCHPYEDPGFLRLPDDEKWHVYLAHAAETVRLVEFQPFVVPWMIQTPDYTRALLAANMAAPLELATEINARRRAVGLIGLPDVELLVHEWSLRTPLHDTTLMSEQLHHLLMMSVRPSVSVRIIPIGQAVHAAGYGPFTLLEFGDNPPAVYREEPAAGVFLDNEREVGGYRAIADRLNKVALDEERSRELMIQVVTDLYGERNADQVPLGRSDTWSMPVRN